MFPCLSAVFPSTELPEERYRKARSKLDTVHYAAETGDIAALDQFVREGVRNGNPESVTLQTREDILGMFPLHIACEMGQRAVVAVGADSRVDGDVYHNVYQPVELDFKKILNLVYGLAAVAYTVSRGLYSWCCQIYQASHTITNQSLQRHTKL